MPGRPIRFRSFARLTAFSLLAGCAAPAPDPAEKTAFALMGDTPYSEGEVRRVDELIDDLNAQKLAFVAHVGDITSGRGPCTDAWFEARRAQFRRLRHPLMLLPGDNDWVDCHRSGFDPLERLAKWRSLFCSLSGDFSVQLQESEYCEHARWEFGGWLFVALNVQGSNDNLGRTAAMDAEHAARSRAVLAWIDDSERVFRERKLRGLVLLMQANPFLKPRGTGASGFDALLEKMASLGSAYPKRIVLVHGDTHTFRDDSPISGVRRIEVHGSPFVAWLKAHAAGAALEIDVGGMY